MLRLFNDPVAMLFLYLAVLALLHGRWATGCLLYRCVCAWGGWGGEGGGQSMYMLRLCNVPTHSLNKVGLKDSVLRQDGPLDRM